MNQDPEESTKPIIFPGGDPLAKLAPPPEAVEKPAPQQIRSDPQTRRALMPVWCMKSQSMRTVTGMISSIPRDRKSGLVRAAAGIWQKLPSVASAAFSATEAMATATTRAREVRELKSQLEELLANLGTQKEKLSQQKLEHETEVCRMTRESENNVLILLNQMYNSDSSADSSEGSTNMCVTKELIEKMLGKEATDLETLLCKNERMTWLEEEVERLKSELLSLRSVGAASKVFKTAAPAAPMSASKKAARRITILKPVAEKYTEEEYFDEFGSSSSSDDSEDDGDDEWRKTPMGKRIKNARQSLAVGGDKRKRVAGAIKEEEDFEEEGEEDGKQPAKKRSSVKAGCKCKSGCKTKACSCRKAGPYCTSLCGCPANKCAHREDPGSDVSVNSTMDTDKENELNEEDGSPDTTDKLLNGTFDLAGKLKFNSNPSTPDNRTPLGSVTSGSIFKTPNSGADMFAEESDIEATPRAKSPIPRVSAANIICSDSDWIY